MAAKTTVRYSPRNDPAVIGAVKTFWMCAAVICASCVPNGRLMFVRTKPPASPRLVSQRFSFDCSTFTASSVSDERAASSCTPPMWPYADTDATTAPGISSIERSRSRMTASSASPIVSGDSGTAMRSALLRASMINVDNAGTFDGAERSAAPQRRLGRRGRFRRRRRGGAAFASDCRHRRRHERGPLRRFGERDEALVENVPVRELLADALGDFLRLRQVGGLERRLPRFVAHVDEADHVAAQIERRSKQPVAGRLEHDVREARLAC